MPRLPRIGRIWWIAATVLLLIGGVAVWSRLNPGDPTEEEQAIAAFQARQDARLRSLRGDAAYERRNLAELGALALDIQRLESRLTNGDCIDEAELRAHSATFESAKLAFADGAHVPLDQAERRLFLMMPFAGRTPAEWTLAEQGLHAPEAECPPAPPPVSALGNQSAATPPAGAVRDETGARNGSETAVGGQ